jgi:ADP-heptose:LPS heptosyltransferase
LKQDRPDLKIGVVVEARFAPVFEGNPAVHQILDPTVGAIARFRPDLCINLHGGTRSMVLSTASGARLRAGFDHYRASGIYNVRIPKAQQILNEDRTVHTAEHLASAMFYLGVKQRPIPRASLFAERRAAESPYAVVHPFAALPEKTWSAEGFLAVAAHLQANGVEPVFIGGPTDDLTPFQAFRSMGGASLNEIKSLLQDATRFVGNDSGPAHMAAAFGVPQVVLFGTSDATVWAPWQVESEVLVADGPIESISTDRVLQSLERLRVAR